MQVCTDINNAAHKQLNLHKWTYPTELRVVQDASQQLLKTKMIQPPSMQVREKQMRKKVDNTVRLENTINYNQWPEFQDYSISLAL